MAEHMDHTMMVVSTGKLPGRRGLSITPWHPLGWPHLTPVGTPENSMAPHVIVLPAPPDLGELKRRSLVYICHIALRETNEKDERAKGMQQGKAQVLNF